MIVGIVGLNGSGKDTFADYIVKKYGFSHKDLGQEIRDELIQKSLACVIMIIGAILIII
jgi:adenylate kinase family enzyme